MNADMVTEARRLTEAMAKCEFEKEKFIAGLQELVRTRNIMAQEASTNPDYRQTTPVALAIWAIYATEVRRIDRFLELIDECFVNLDVVYDAEPKTESSREWESAHIWMKDGEGEDLKIS